MSYCYPDGDADAQSWQHPACWGARPVLRKARGIGRRRVNLALGHIPHPFRIRSRGGDSTREGARMAGCSQDMGMGRMPIVVLRLGVAPKPSSPTILAMMQAGLCEEIVLVPGDGTARSDTVNRRHVACETDWERNLDQLLHREAVGVVDVLSIHGAGSTMALLTGLGLHRRRTRIIHCTHPAWPEGELAMVSSSLQGEGYAITNLPDGVLAEWPNDMSVAIDAMGVAIGAGTAAVEPLSALWRRVRIAPADDAAWERLVEGETARGALDLALEALSAWQAASGPRVARCVTLATERYASLHQAGDHIGAERLAAGLAAVRPDHLEFLRAALGCNLALGHSRRAQCFASALVAREPQEPLAHLALADAYAAAGNARAEAKSRRVIAMSFEGVLHPLRRLYEAHRAASLMLLQPMDDDARAQLAGLAAMAARIDPTTEDDTATRHWMMHYRSLVAAADPAALSAKDAGMPPPGEITFCDCEGRPKTVSRLRRRAAWREAKLVFVVAADEAYLRLYGRAYLNSVIANTDVPYLAVVHVIGGRERLSVLASEIGILNSNIFYSGCKFNAKTVLTQCHDSDGPRAWPAAHLQSKRFSLAEYFLKITEKAIIISDIDVVLQKGVSDLLERHAADDVVMNRNADSVSFGSHITANLLLIRPSPSGLEFAGALREFLEAMLAAPDVTRWIDQCGIQMVWNRQGAVGSTRFGWFDTRKDINNVIYKKWEANPFTFLSLFHGFDMASLPNVTPRIAA